MDESTYQTNSTDNGDHVLRFNVEGIFERKVFIPRSEFRPNPYVWVIDEKFRTLYQSDAQHVYRWLENDSDRALAKQVGIGKDFQLLSIQEFKELYR